MTPPKPVYNSPAGRTLVKRILRDHGIRPHDYQLDGIVIFLDGESLMETMATGAGKTGFYAFTMIVMIAISRDPSLALEGATFPKNPAMVITLPTKDLQDDMKGSLTKLGLDAVVINGDEEKANPRLWEECREKHSMPL
ncbi:hypothetical protein NMY22_g20182 [Coprinellus aureogranulatus]|nr:hypothetical protein NMY22_g20182 [Coprinellus aureogranulatus]